MAEQSTNGPDRLDYATSTSICRAIGEKLVGMGPSDDVLPPQFQSLLAAMQRQEDQERSSSE